MGATKNDFMKDRQIDIDSDLDIYDIISINSL